MAKVLKALKEPKVFQLKAPKEHKLTGGLKGYSVLADAVHQIMLEL